MKRILKKLKLKKILVEKGKMKVMMMEIRVMNTISIVRKG